MSTHGDKTAYEKSWLTFDLISLELLSKLSNGNLS